MQSSKPVRIRAQRLTAAGLVTAAIALVVGATHIFSHGATASRRHLDAKAPTASEAAARLAGLPIYFEKNQGQVNRSVRYLARTGRYSLFLTDDAAVFSLIGGVLDKGPMPAGFAGKHDATNLIESDLRIRLIGANPHPEVAGLTPLAARVNYLIGNDSSRWHRDVPTFERVRYRDVYPGVDLLYYGKPDALEYDFVAAPGADTSKIRFAIEGRAASTLDAAGNLSIETAAGTMTIMRPNIYQENPDGTRTRIDGSFRLARDGTIEAGIPRRDVAIELADYDHSRKLVIDPQIAYSTYYGGHASSTGPVNLEQFSAILGGNKKNPLTVADVGFDVAIDPSGFGYLTGSAFSNDLPMAGRIGTPGGNNPPQQNPNVLVAKFDPTKSGNSSLVYATYLGAAGDTAASDVGNGDGDLAFGITVDGNGEAFVVGQTYSPGKTFPGTASCGAFGQSNNQGAPSTNVGFVSELNTAGNNVVYSCYIDGSENATAARVALLPGCQTNCQAFISGSTQSTAAEGFPVTANAFQTDLKATNGKSNAFFLVVHANGTAEDYCTYYGGSGNGTNADAGLGIAVDSNGNGYITGGTFSADLKTTANAAQTSYSGGGNSTSNAFVAELDTKGDLLYGTYLGGSGTAGVAFAVGDVGSGIALDPNKIWVTGLTASLDFPVPGASMPNIHTATPAFQSTNVPNTTAGAPATAAFVTELDPTQAGLAQILYSTYFGGDGTPISEFGFPIAAFGEAATGIAVVNGKVFITGGTASTSGLPLSPAACHQTNSSAGIMIDGFDVPFTAFVAELDPTQAVAANQLVFSTYLGGSGTADVAGGLEVDTGAGHLTSGDIYVGGLTFSSDFPVTTTGFQQTNSAAAKSATNAFFTVIDPTSSDCSLAGLPSPTPTPVGATATPTSTPSPTPPGATATPTPTPSGAPATPTPTPPAAATPTPTPVLAAGGTLTGVPHEINFHVVGTDTKSPVHVFKIKNTGKTALNGFVNASATTNPPVIVTGTGPFTLGHNASTTVTVQADPDHAEQGQSISGSLVITSGDPKHPMETVTIAGTAIAGKIKAPLVLAFGKVKVGKTPSKSFKLMNVGPGVLHVTGVNGLSSPFTLTAPAAGSLPAALLSGKPLTITVEFAPGSKSPQPNETLHVLSDDPNTPNLAITVTGQGK